MKYKLSNLLADSAWFRALDFWSRTPVPAVDGSTSRHSMQSPTSMGSTATLALEPPLPPAPPPAAAVAAAQLTSRTTASEASWSTLNSYPLYVPPDSSHKHELTTLVGLHWCHRCQTFLWGFRNQGYRCKSCREIVCGACKTKSIQDRVVCPRLQPKVQVPAIPNFADIPGIIGPGTTSTREPTPRSAGYVARAREIAVGLRSFFVGKVRTPGSKSQRELPRADV